MRMECAKKIEIILGQCYVCEPLHPVERTHSIYINCFIHHAVCRVFPRYGLTFYEIENNWKQ